MGIAMELRSALPPFRSFLLPALCALSGARAAAAAARPSLLSTRDAPSADAARGLFREKMLPVLTHPRCQNCHTFTDWPRQGNARVQHIQNVRRGAANHGVPSLPCQSCHQAANTADGAVPGNPAWALAPLSMGWEGLDAGALCRVMLDPAKNGGRDLAATVHHLTEDALVQWAWNPGKREAPPVPQKEFHAAVKRWAAAGAPCPGG